MSRVTVRVGAKEGGALAATDLEHALAAASFDLNTRKVLAIAVALRHAVANPSSELALDESQALALLAQIGSGTRTRGRLEPLAAAIKRALPT